MFKIGCHQRPFFKPHLFQTPVLLEIVGLFVLQKKCYDEKSTLVAASAVS